jgi:hypothetical protein
MVINITIKYIFTIAFIYLIENNLQEAGSRKQEAGSRKQEAGSRKQEAGSRKQGLQHDKCFYRFSNYFEFICN